MRFDVEVFGEKLVSRELISRGERALHPWPFWNAAAEFLMRVEKAQFDTDGAYASGGWDPLELSTIASKRARGLPHPERPLHGTGRLEDSLTKRGHPAQKLRISENELVFGSFATYLKYHQSPAPRHHLPRRQVLQLTTLDKKFIERGMSLWVTRGTVLPGLGGHP